MKNKFITVTVVLCSIIVIISITFILTGLANSSRKNNNEDNNINSNVTINTNNDNKNNNNDSSNDKYDSIVITSKFAQDITDMLSFSNVYSKSFVNELQINGLNDKARRIFGYIKATKEDKYNAIHRISEEYTGYYFSSTDFEKVLKDYFYESDNIQHGIVTQDYSYDSVNKNYVVTPVGFGGSDFDFVIEVPYEMREYTDRLEVYMYRVYVQSKLDIEENVESLKDVIYYDIDKTNKAIEVESGILSYEETQIQTITDFISEGKLNKENLFKVKYELKKKDSKYLISNYEEIK